jgi:hypothetical protein
MSQEKYIGMDVHQATISVAVTDSRGKLIMESILETKAATILEFIQGLHGAAGRCLYESVALWRFDSLRNSRDQRMQPAWHPHRSSACKLPKPHSKSRPDR